MDASGNDSTTDNRFACPVCGEFIPVAARACRFCDAILTEKDKPRPSSQQQPAVSVKPAQSNVKDRVGVKPAPIRRIREERPRTGYELGLGIGSLVVGVLTSLCTIPAAVVCGLLSVDPWFIASVLPFAITGGICGFIGRRSSLGVAGVVLSIVAVLEAFGVLGYSHYQRTVERSMEYASKKEERERANSEAMRAIAERQKAEAQAEAEKAKNQAISAKAIADSQLEQRKLELEANKLLLEQQKAMAARKQSEEVVPSVRTERDLVIPPSSLTDAKEPIPLEQPTKQDADTAKRMKAIAAEREISAIEARIAEFQRRITVYKSEKQKLSNRMRDLDSIQPRPSDYEQAKNSFEIQDQLNEKRMNECESGITNAQREIQQKRNSAGGL
jgi:stage V sporulation protein SpoVS